MLFETYIDKIKVELQTKTILNDALKKQIRELKAQSAEMQSDLQCIEKYMIPELPTECSQRSLGGK